MASAAAKLAIERTRLRLLVLYSRVLQYRWENEKLPQKLDMVAPRQMLVDPINGGPFDYQITGDKTFRVQSAGPNGKAPIMLEPDAKPAVGDKLKVK